MVKRVRELAVDGRNAERFPLSLSLAYAIESDGGRLEGHTRTTNVGGSGIRFLISQMVAPQSTCRVTLTLPEHPEPVSFVGQVVWCRQGHGTQKRQCEVGMAFVPGSCDEATFARYCQFIATQLVTKYLR